ncbi:unnamed protein product [Paramecium octaurelia]|uniref:Pyridine nucleotide-disulphide oxidoreductase dimerisation domain-containing protein n=1 Tax=Paramecium octaurelia TaxID=43137 RepID=A0A8S1XW57_PAROT|nr:unnamed protein product [Paramecium octaurelia]
MIKIFQNQLHILKLKTKTHYTSSCLGLSEEKQLKIHGRENLKIFENVFKPVNWNISARNASICQGKLIVRKVNEQIVKFHYIGLEAAEMTQCFTVAIRIGAKKSDFYSNCLNSSISGRVIYNQITYRRWCK